ncbi:unnamed protein product [marine sediment metagenome]|uniref:Uncharacterized protein n=1 Tax=marine sediment metagenome TaxID=412755 RepID=X0V3Q7_9ZZZZ
MDDMEQETRTFQQATEDALRTLHRKIAEDIYKPGPFTAHLYDTPIKRTPLRTRAYRWFMRKWPICWKWNAIDWCDNCDRGWGR